MVQLKINLQKEHERMKKAEDKHRSEREFHRGDWVYLRLQPYRQVSVGGMRNQKLISKFYGPFEVLKRICTLAYQLNLPPDSQIHPIFHVSQLKSKLEEAHVPLLTLPVMGPEAIRDPIPHLVLDRRMVKRQNAAAAQLLVQWKDQSIENVTWEDYKEMVK